MMGALCGVLGVKSESDNPLLTKAEQLMYIPKRAPEKKWLDKIFNGLG